MVAPMGTTILLSILAFWAVASLARIAKSLERIALVNEAFAGVTLATPDEIPASSE
jgi:hypothetical protein